MLILGRRAGESIVIDGGIRIVVVSCDRRGVRLGFEAPESVGIVRGEILEQEGAEGSPRRGRSLRKEEPAPSTDSASSAADETTAAIPAEDAVSGVYVLPPPPTGRPAGSRGPGRES